MKKRLALLLAGLLAVGSLTACGGGNDTDAKVKIGLGATTSFSSSKSIGEEDHGQVRTDSNAQADITVATVMLDADGKILQCVMDVVQVKATIADNGEMTTDPTTTFKTKKELGPDYNMKPASGIQKEWDEQAVPVKQLMKLLQVLVQTDIRLMIHLKQAVQCTHLHL